MVQEKILANDLCIGFVPGGMCSKMWMESLWAIAQSGIFESLIFTAMEKTQVCSLGFVYFSFLLSLSLSFLPLRWLHPPLLSKTPRPDCVLASLWWGLETRPLAKAWYGRDVASLVTVCNLGALSKARLRKVHSSGRVQAVFDFLSCTCSLGIPLLWSSIAITVLVCEIFTAVALQDWVGWGNRYRNFGEWQPALRGTPGITGLALVRIIYHRKLQDRALSK